MAVSNFGLDTLTRSSGFGGSWSNQAQTNVFTKRLFVAVRHYVTMNTNDKIRVVVTSVNGSALESIEESVRLTIRKKLS